MHPLDLPSPEREALWSLQPPRLTPIVEMIATMRVGSTMQPVNLDVTDRLLAMPSFSTEVPRMPGDTDYTNAAVDTTIELSNTDGFIGVTQAGSGVRASDIEQGEFVIYVSIGTPTPIQFYRGRIQGRPTEQRGTVSYRVSGVIWEPIRRPVLYEDFGQSAESGGSTFFTNPVRIDVLGQHFCIHSGIVYFNGAGRCAPRFSQEGSVAIQLLRIDLGNALKLGTYRIEFRDARNYTITYPDNQVFAGNIGAVTPPESAVTIRPGYWLGTNGTGTVIEFKVGWVAKGNPVAIAFNLLEKGLLQNWGAIPGLSPSARLDIGEWMAAAQRFASFEVMADATNEDNKVWEQKGTARPLSCARLAQQVLDHVGCSLNMKADGSIGVQIPYLDDSDVWPLTTKESILGDGIEISGDEAVNTITLQYGFDSQSKAYSGSLRSVIGQPSEEVELVVSAPFYKLPRHLVSAKWLRDTIMRRNLTRQAMISFEITPQSSLTLMAGDSVIVKSALNPVIELPCRIVNITKTIGEASRVQAVFIQMPEGAAQVVCLSAPGNLALY